ncbi:hypothetical protein WDW89_23165 [Deltaproteobacteria bacterium TL4]
MQHCPDEEFYQEQMQEIYSYVEQHCDKSPNGAALDWIERFAAEFRRHWEDEHAL